ncbi:hypothetical protein LDENG_00290730 [Lucifuga dentata]|nr:hypothetical protein LDENG_00290730 [Lucifuga dentata]
MALTSSKVPFKWTSAVEEAFKTLKLRFTSAPILQMPEPDCQLVVEVDASDVGVGAVLSQRSVADQKLHPCAFFSRRLTPAERNYDIGNRDLLAVKLALEEWRHWLEGSKVPFLVWTDHKNLDPGSCNIKPDALSRQFQGEEESGPHLDAILPASCVFATVSWEIEEKIKSALEDQPGPSTCPPDWLFVPEPLRPEILQWAHASRLFCHPGIQRTISVLQRRFWWTMIEEDTREFVNACPVCNQHKPSHHSPAGLLQPLPMPHRPWSHISLDL